ncbi:MAG: hypothetical protein HY671_07275 [Chloroflexi bacterium]|nr:hypothetical protein [Chloroflexota bacterium]
MTTFSQRKGLKPVKQVIQVDDMDADLRNSLWNAMDLFYWQQFAASSHGYGWKAPNLVIKLWRDYFKLPIDTMNDGWYPIRDALRKYYFGCRWNEVYDFVEFIANSENSQINRVFMESCNSILEREVSGYRFAGGEITQITSEAEVSEIEQALDSTLKPVAAHLPTALGLLSDRKCPDLQELYERVHQRCRGNLQIGRFQSEGNAGRCFERDWFERQGRVARCLEKRV